MLCSYDDQTRRMEKGYPKPLEVVFSGMTGKVTAAFQTKGKGFTKYNKMKSQIKSHLTLSFMVIFRVQLSLQRIKDVRVWLLQQQAVPCSQQQLFPAMLIG